MNCSIIPDCAAACVCPFDQSAADCADESGSDTGASRERFVWVSPYLIQPRRSYAEVLSDRRKPAG